MSAPCPALKNDPNAQESRYGVGPALVARTWNPGVARSAVP
jgi:hypothetical protein